MTRLPVIICTHDPLAAYLQLSNTVSDYPFLGARPGSGVGRWRQLLPLARQAKEPLS